MEVLGVRRNCKPLIPPLVSATENSLHMYCVPSPYIRSSHYV